MEIDSVKLIEFLNVVIYIFCMLVTLSLLFGCISQEGRNSLFMKLFTGLLTVHIICMLGETGLWLFHEREFIPLAKFCALLCFGGGTVLISLYAYCIVAFISQRTAISFKWAHFIALICSVYLIIVVISLFNGMLFDFDVNGFYIDGPYYGIVRVLDLVTWILCIGLVLMNQKALSYRNMFSLLSFVLYPFIAMCLLSFWDATPLSMATTLSMINLYGLFTGEMSAKLVEQERQLHKQEQLITQQKVATMISQIQPHFIYNTLGSIYQLCLSEPEKAAKLTQDFSLYLRGNFNELDSIKPVSINKEMEHVRYYLNIEQIRFPDIEVIYNLESSDFLIPALSVQPLVENAVKHGLMGLESGGKIIISSYEDENSYYVKVEDNGVGFDSIDESKKHIGISNIRGRLKAMCQAELIIESEINKGTRATIVVPKEKLR
ncbi:MAG: sensor histidine kinase [Erysipelotrichaceae bacterium]